MPAPHMPRLRCNSFLSYCLGERYVDDVFGDEPDLKLVDTDDAAHEQIVRAVITVFGRQACHRACLLEDDLMCVQQTGDLDGGLLTAPGWSGDEGRLRHVVSHGEGHTAEQLNPLGDRVHEVILL